MIQVELQSLVKKLSPSLKTYLEAAAGECVNRRHFSIELEHWFFVLLQQSKEWSLALEFASLHQAPFLESLNSQLVVLARGNQSTPSLSSSLVDFLKDAWLLASLNDAQFLINEFHLLMVLEQRVAQGAYQGVLASWVKGLSLEWLRTQASSLGETQPHSNLSSSKYSSPSEGTFASPALDKYAQNLTQAARNGELDPISGRGDEIRKAIDILCRRRQNSPILVGDPGVGKTAIVEGLAQQIVAGNVPPALLEVELLSLDLSLLQAGASIKGEFENRLKDVINEIKHSPKPIIVFIDEAHTLIGAGGAAGQNDAANILKPALARGEFRSLAATTWAEYKKYFESDAALARRFQLLSVTEPNESDAIQMLSGMKKSLESHHKVKLRKEAIEAAVSLSVRYLPERKLPDKAISLLDTACSRIGLTQSTIPHALESIIEESRYIDNDIEILEREVALWSVGEESLITLKNRRALLQIEHDKIHIRWEKEKEDVAEILSLQTQLEGHFIQGTALEHSSMREMLVEKMGKLSEFQGESPLVLPQVTKQTVAEVIALWTGIPVGNMLKKELDKVLDLERHIAERVIGQDAAMSQIAEAIRMSRAGLTDPRKPIGVFLLCGPSGVGKTETALALASLLYGGEHNITTINMTEFKEAHKVSMLLGSPAGYVGYGKGGVLTEAVRKNPYSILLLDEMEKAHPSVHDIFYQIFDKGRISDSEGQMVDFRNTIVIMTSNAADDAVVSACLHARPSSAQLAETIFPDLQRFFNSAFLGRTVIVPYYPLNDDEMGKIACLSLDRIKKRIEERYSAQLSYTYDVIEFLVKMNHFPETGARAIEQLINSQLMPTLSHQCLMHTSRNKTIEKISLDVLNGGFIIKIDE